MNTIWPVPRLETPAYVGVERDSIVWVISPRLGAICGGGPPLGDVYKRAPLSPAEFNPQSFHLASASHYSTNIRTKQNSKTRKMQPFIAKAVEDKKNPVEQGQDLCMITLSTALISRCHHVNSLIWESLHRPSMNGVVKLLDTSSRRQNLYYR